TASAAANSHTSVISLPVNVFNASNFDVSQCTRSLPPDVTVNDSISHFSGKTNEQPNKFLHEYQQTMRTLFRASNLQLLRNICNWLSGLARDWYLQLLQSRQLPNSWSEFKKMFLSRFRSLERVEALKFERSHCAQGENETVEDFYQRYLGLNLEISPKIKEKVLKKQLLRKLRPEILLWMKGNPDSMSLDDVLKKAEKAELQLLYRRKEETQKGIEAYNVLLFQLHLIATNL
ncbi:unnamed protein product, partial [Didymodactylos carnosus]